MRWTKQQIATLKAMLPHCSIELIAKCLSTTPRVVYRKLNRMDLTYECHYHLRANERAGMVSKYRKMGKSYTDIAFLIGTSVGQASRIGRQLGMPIRGRGR